MARQVRKTSPEIVEVALAVNDIKAQIGAGSSFHLDRSEVVPAQANASNLASSLLLCNELLAVYAFHMADTLAHKVAGVALASYVPATDLASAILRANDMKAKYNAHAPSTTYHYTTDATNAVAAVDATDQASLNTLLNEIKADVTAHMASGPVGKSLRVVDA